MLPTIIAVILGPRAELQMRRTFQLSDGSISGLWSEPLAVAIYVVVALILFWPLLNRFVVRRVFPGRPGAARPLASADRGADDPT